MSTKRPVALHQVLATRDTVKSDIARTMTSVYNELKRAEKFAGFMRTYQPLADDGARLPGERQMVQARAMDLIATAEAAQTRLFDFTATIDAANKRAVADIVIDGAVIAAAVPATTLLWMEKQLQELLSLWRAVPLLAPDKEWTFSDTSLVYEAAPIATVRNEKSTRALVLYDATDKHPAQVRELTTDVPAGTWTVVHMSGAVPMGLVAAKLDRLTKLVIAVKTARELANTQAVEDVSIGDKIFGYLNS